MSRRFLLICACWTLLALVAGLVGVWRIHTQPIQGVAQELRAAKLGMSIGALTATGYALFWLMTALTARRRKPQPRTDKHDSEESENSGT